MRQYIKPLILSGTKYIHPLALFVKNKTFYFMTTLKLDAMGCVHMWEENVTVVQYGKYSLSGNDREADVFVQHDTDVEALREYLTDEERTDLDSGCTVITSNIPSDYFIHD